jgi:hypothetical protein
MEMNDVRTLGAEQAAKAECRDDVDVVPNRERAQTRVGRRNAAGERSGGGRSE